MNTPERELTIRKPKLAASSENEGEIMEQNSLPNNLITTHILTRLPIKTLMKFKLVSRLWYSTISSNQFANAHFKLSPFSQPCCPVQYLFVHTAESYYLFDYEKYKDGDFDGDDNDNDNVEEDDDDNINNNKGLVKLEADFGEPGFDKFLVDSCNGLVCLGSFDGKFFIIWNPTIFQWRNFEDPYVLGIGKCWAAWGFGYVSSVDEYKVVRVLEVAETLEIQVHVFSLRTNMWKRIDAEYLHNVISLRAMCMGFDEADHGEQDRDAVSCVVNHGVVVNETVFWIVTMLAGHGRHVVAFDLACETFDVVPHVAMFDDDDNYRIEILCDMGGILSTLRANLDGDASLNLLKQRGEMEVIPLFRHEELSNCEAMIAITRTGNIFIQLGDGECEVIEFNPKSSDREYTTVLTLESRERNTRIANYVQSVISPLTMAE